MLRVRELVFPERQHISIGVRNHGHYAPGLLGRLGGKPDTAIVQLSTVVQQIRDEEGDSGMPADQGLCLGVNSGMDTDVGVTLQKLRAKRSLLSQRQTEL